MQRIGLTRASIVFPITAFLARIGAPIERLLVQAGLPAWALNDPEALIPTSSTARLLTGAARSQGIENLGLLSGQEACIETLGLYGRLIRRAPTLGDALEELVRGHSIFSSSGRIWLVPRGENVELCQAFVCKFDASDDGWQQANHYVLMLLLGIIRLAADPGWRPAAIHLQTGESRALRDAEIFSTARLAFAQPATSIMLPRKLFDRPLERPALAVEDIAARSIDRWKASAPAHDFARSIGQVVEMLSWEGYPDIRRTADVLGMSARTLQRYLAAAGITHESLVGRARFTTATALLEETDTKILDIALDLGYSDHAHFTRAFRRWAGCSPQQYRRRSTEDRNGSKASCS